MSSQVYTTLENFLLAKDNLQDVLCLPGPGKYEACAEDKKRQYKSERECGRRLRLQLSSLIGGHVGTLVAPPWFRSLDEQSGSAPQICKSSARITEYQASAQIAEN